jgi:uncharacterized phage-associated protein
MSSESSLMDKASPISDFFIAFSHEHGDLLSNLKLQKLLYYAIDPNHSLYS